MIQKAQDFRTMVQGTMKVEEYERHFMKMMRYAPDDTNTDEKKQFWFQRGRMRVPHAPPPGEPLHRRREGEAYLGGSPAQ